MSDANATLAGIVERAGRLYTLPRVAMEVLELTENPKTDAGLLKKCIENDPALTARLLRIVNSSLFGLSREVSDLNQALALLGIKPLKLLVLGFSLPDALFAGLAGDVLGRYWQQSLCKAVAARETASGLWRIAGDEAFIAGLLQDLGLLVLVQDAGASFADFWRRVQESNFDLLEAERRVLGFDHTELSAHLLERWQLPRRIVQAVAARSGGGTCDHQSTDPLCAVVRLAGLVTQIVVDGQTSLWPNLLAAGEQYRGIRAEQWTELIVGLQEHVEQLAEILQVKLPDADYQRLLEQAREQLACCAADAALDLVRARQHGYDCELETLLALEEVRRLHAHLEGRNRRAAPVEHPAAPGRDAATALSRQFTAMAPGATGCSDAVGTPAGAATGSAPAAPGVRGCQRDAMRWQRHPEAQPSADDAPGNAGAWTALHGLLREQAITCRQARQSLSLLLLELHGTARRACGWEYADPSQLGELLGTVCRRIDHRGARCVPLDVSRLAIVLPDCDRREAVEHAHAATAAFRRLLVHSQIDTTLAVAGGVASVVLPPPNFQPEDLLVSAARCLNAARDTGSDCVKSIEVY